MKIAYFAGLLLLLSACGADGGKKENTNINSSGGAGNQSSSVIQQTSVSSSNSSSVAPSSISSSQSNLSVSSSLVNSSSSRLSSSSSRLASSLATSSLRSASSVSYSAHSFIPCEQDSSCEEPNSDWYTDKESDQAGTHHTPDGSEITSLQAEHITPYGGWFTFESPSTEANNSHVYICWSTNANGLDDLRNWSDSKLDEECPHSYTDAREGARVLPLIVTEVNPDTTYYYRVMHIGDGNRRVSNVVAFKTRPDPRIELGNNHPRVFFTEEQLIEMRNRYLANDSRIKYWIDSDEERTRRAPTPPGPTSLGSAWAYGIPSYVMGRVKNDETLIEGAKDILFTHLLPPYETLLTGNDYRWASPQLAALTDLLWDQLTQSERERILDAILLQDEYDPHLNPLFTDTDEHASCTQIQIAHGLTFLGSTDLDPAKLERLSKVFDKALRRWYGLSLVKARRANGYWGLAGGTMDDGTAYSVGTRRYWLETFWMLENAGFPQGEYAPWIWNHARSHVIYPLVPDKSGPVTFGDIENYQSNGVGEVIPSWEADPLGICLLNRYGWTTEAGYLRDALSKTRSVDSTFGPELWAMACDNPQIPAQDYTTLPTAFRADGFGMVFDRTGWGTDDAFLFFTAGWRAVDHTHDDSGHFSFWVNGKFLTHEHPDYGHDVINVQQHNVLLHENAMQNEAANSRILKTVSTSSHLYILADLTSAYSEDARGSLPRKVFTNVTRSLYWDKTTNIVVVYDRVVGAPDGEMEQNILGEPSLYYNLGEDHNSTLSLEQIKSAGLGDLQVTKFAIPKNGDTQELMMIVNGTGTLMSNEDSIGVLGVVGFNRSTGEMQ